MEKSSFIPKTIDEYISTFPEEIQLILNKLRAVIKEAAPDAVEKIAYNMPAFELKGPLVYFAVAKKHIGFYPTPSGIDAYKEELSEYEVSKGTIRFPLDKPLPFDLIKKIVKSRIEENFEKAKLKESKKKKG